MSNEYRTVYGEASTGNGTAVTLLAGHVAVFSDLSTSPPTHIGTARWLDGKFKGAPEYLSIEALTSLAASLTRAISQPWVVYKASSAATKADYVLLTGLNLWTGGELYWTMDRAAFVNSSYEAGLINWTQATFDPEAYSLLLSWGVTLP